MYRTKNVEDRFVHFACSHGEGKEQEKSDRHPQLNLFKCQVCPAGREVKQEFSGGVFSPQTRYFSQPKFTLSSSFFLFCWGFFGPQWRRRPTAAQNRPFVQKHLRLRSKKNPPTLSSIRADTCHKLPPRRETACQIWKAAGRRRRSVLPP